MTAKTKKNNYTIYLAPERVLNIEAENFVEDKKTVTFLNGTAPVAKFYVGDGLIGWTMEEEENADGS